MSAESDSPVLDIWVAGMPVTLGEETKATKFGTYLGKSKEEGFVKVKIVLSGQETIEEWPLKNTFAEN